MPQGNRGVERSKNHEHQNKRRRGNAGVYVKVEPSDKLEIEIESVVYNQYADQIKQSVQQVLDELDVKSGKISVNDKGAVDCVIQARVETAIKRAGGEN